MKTSKVLVANLVLNANNQPKQWSSDHGLFFFHWIEFENGDKGEYMSKAQAQNKFIPNQEREYSLTPNGQHANKIKPEDSSYQNNQPAQNYQAPAPQHATTHADTNKPFDVTRNSIEKQTCIKAAADFHRETGVTIDTLMESAKIMHAWITSE